MRPARASVLSILVVLVAALGACGGREEAAAPETAPAEQAAPAAVPEPEAAAVAPAEPAPAAEPTPAAAEPTPAAAEPAAPPGGAAAEPAAAAQPATIEFEIYKAGFIVGVSGGRGTLHFQGRAHPVSIGGVSVGASAGISKAELLGTVHNLNRLADIEGTYSAAQAGVALGGGEKITRLENSRGVVLEVRGKQIGIEVALDLNGMQISLK
jgi:hypothetical protein